jgi:hypothetical protein
MTSTRVGMAVLLAASWGTGYLLSRDPLVATVLGVAIAAVLVLASVGAHTIWQRTDHAHRITDLEQRQGPDLSRYATKGDLGQLRVWVDGELTLLHDCKANVTSPVPRRVPPQRRAG